MWGGDLKINILPKFSKAIKYFWIKKKKKKKINHS